MDTKTRFFLEAQIVEINKFIERAHRYDGRVLGDYVRNVIVPRKCNREADVKYEDGSIIHIWFETIGNADNFIREEGKNLESLTSTFKPRFYDSEVNVRAFYLMKYNTCLGWINIYVSRVVPLIDFNVNLLGYTLNGMISYGEECVSDLINSIQAKKITMLPKYIDFLSKLQEHNYLIPQHCKYINNNYIKDGWSIHLSGGQEIIPESFTIDWLHQVLSNREKTSATNNINSSPTNVTTESTSHFNREEALAAFNTAQEAMRLAFLRLLDSK